MNIFKKKNENRLSMPDKVKRGFRYYCTLVVAVALMGCCTMTAFAAEGGERLSQSLCKPPKWCRIGASHWRF